MRASQSLAAELQGFTRSRDGAGHLSPPWSCRRAPNRLRRRSRTDREPRPCGEGRVGGGVERRDRTGRDQPAEVPQGRRDRFRRAAVGVGGRSSFTLAGVGTAQDPQEVAAALRRHDRQPAGNRRSRPHRSRNDRSTQRSSATTSGNSPNRAGPLPTARRHRRPRASPGPPAPAIARGSNGGPAPMPPRCRSGSAVGQRSRLPVAAPAPGAQPARGAPRRRPDRAGGTLTPPHPRPAARRAWTQRPARPPEPGDWTTEPDRRSRPSTRCRRRRRRARPARSRRTTRPGSALSPEPRCAQGSPLSPPATAGSRVRAANEAAATI